MEEVSKVIIKPLQQSIYMKPYTMHFVQNGVKRTWDLLTIHDSFRPAVYFGSIPEEDRKFDEEIDMKKYPPSLGVTLELCAGIIDKQKSEEVIAKEEVLEECGYDVPISSLEKIGLYRSGVGTSASLQTAFYCEVTDEMKVSAGGGVDDEIIEVVEMTVGDIKKYVTQDYIKSPPSFMFAIYWFLYHKQNNVN